MLTLPKKYDTLISTFAPPFSKRIWAQIQVLIVGALLAPGKRTVTSVLRVMGLSDEEHFQNYHSGTAIWTSPGKPVLPIRWVLIRDPKGKFKPQALLCTDQQAKPVQILQWFVMRWQEEVTFREVRTHLGVETQRQWSDLAIARTTPTLLGLFSLVALLADQSTICCKLPIRQAAWYCKPLPTFSDALAVVRDQLWQAMTFHISPSATDMAKAPRILLKRFTEALCYAP